LEILEESGVTAQMLALGLPIRGACIRSGKRPAQEIVFSDLHPKYSFMLALSQAETERLLTAALEAAGGHVERERKLMHCQNTADGVTLTIESPDGTTETLQAPWMLAADGAHSTVREELGIDFPGSVFDEEWHLLDVPLRSDLARDRAHVIFNEDGGFVFALQVVDGRTPKDGPMPVWRIIGSQPNPLSRLAQRIKEAGEPIWVSSFRVAHRMNAAMQAGNVYFAGDAAHIHSPMGARGMNLGLEDAWVFAALASKGELAKYHALRYPVDAKVVRRVKLMSEIVASKSRLLALARRLIIPVVYGVPALRRRLFRTLTGLDHQLPAGCGV
jgi:2-polyprenyl-6-methoxyphenol hydroxylase-like FAD-dependent oxidoreductase